MTDQWAVVLDTGGERNNAIESVVIYGPIEDEATAQDFARFLTAEVDPAVAVQLLSPTKELLAYWKTVEEQRTL